jgi:hypothetical protein
MASLGEITSEADRKAAQAAAAAAAPDPAEAAAAAKTALQQHFCRAIKAWTSAKGPQAVEGDFKFREDLIDDACITMWEGELTAAGYNVTRADGNFVVSLTPSEG